MASPYVVVEVHGGGRSSCAVAAGSPMKPGAKYTTAAVQGNGLLPEWGEHIECIADCAEEALLSLSWFKVRPDLCVDSAPLAHLPLARTQGPPTQPQAQLRQPRSLVGHHGRGALKKRGPPIFKPTGTRAEVDAALASRFALINIWHPFGPLPVAAHSVEFAAFTLWVHSRLKVFLGCLESPGSP